MALPGFTAEVSLYTSRRQYRTAVIPAARAEVWPAYSACYDRCYTECMKDPNSLSYECKAICSIGCSRPRPPWRPYHR